MTEEEITLARDDLAQLDIEQLRCGVMLQLLKIEALTKKLDESRRQSDLQMNSAIKFCQERNEARIERDELNVHVKLLQNNNISRCANFELLTKERDTLEAAAKLALSALNMSKIYVSVHGWDDEIDQVYNTIESLRRVGVQ